jgi:hypothetical protein
MTDNITLPSDPIDRKKIKDAIIEASYVLDAIESKRDQLKDIIDVINSEYKLSKKILRKTIRIYHKQNYNEVCEENNELELVCESLLGIED